MTFVHLITNTDKRAVFKVLIIHFFDVAAGRRLVLSSCRARPVPKHRMGPTNKMVLTDHFVTVMPKHRMVPKAGHSMRNYAKGFGHLLLLFLADRCIGRGYCHRPDVCPSVWNNRELWPNGWMDRADFWHRPSSPQTPSCIRWESPSPYFGGN